MDRSQVGLTIRLLAALGLAGLGHYFLAFQRDVYPLDGYVFYAVAAILFASTLRAARNWPKAEWSRIRDPIVEIGRAVRRLASTLLQVRFGPTLFVGLTVLNLLSAALAVLLGSWLALVGWLASVVWLAAIVRPRSVREVSSETPALHESIVEIAEQPGRLPQVARGTVGLLLAVLGQIVIATDRADTVFNALGEPIAEALRLQMPGGGSAVVGLLILAIAMIAFAWATRGISVVDRPLVSVDVRAGQPRGWGGRWLGVAATGLGVWLLVLRSVADGATGFGPLVLWLAALALIGAVWRKIDLDRGVNLRIELDRREAYGLMAMMVAALLIGLLQLDRLPASIWGDEGAYWTLARDTAAGLVPINAFGMGTYSYPFAGSIYQSFWVGLFGPTVWSWRAGTLIAAVVAMLPLYFLGRGLLGRRTAFVSLAFYATSPMLLAYGRTGYLYALSIVPVVAGAALVVAAVRRDSRLFACLAGVASGAGFMLYPSAQFGVVLCLLVLIGFVVARMTRGAAVFRLGLSFVSAVILAITPALVYGLVREPAAFIDKAFQSSLVNVAFAETVLDRDELLARASFISTRDNQLFFEPAMYGGLALRGWVRTAIGLHRPDLVNERYVVGPLAGPLTLLYLLGLGWCLVRWRRPGYGIWPIWLFAGTFLLSAIASFPPHSTDLLPLVPALAVLAAIGLVGVVDSLAVGWLDSWSRRLRSGWWAGSLLVVVTLAVSALGLRAYFVEMPQRYPPNLEMRMFWSALDLPRGSTIVFVRDEVYAPDFQPWGIQNFKTGTSWQMIEPGALNDFDFRSACAIGCRIFYTPPYANATEARLREVLGPGSVTPYPNEAGDVIGYAFSPAGRP